MLKIYRSLFPAFVSGRGAVGLLILRLVAGAALMQHGWPKIQHAFGWMGPDAAVPGIFQALSALAEFGGGLALILGLLTPIAAFGIACNMAVAIFMVHVPHGDPFVGAPGKPSFEPAIGYFAIGCMYMLVGPGTLSLDAYILGRICATHPKFSNASHSEPVNTGHAIR